MKTIDGKYYVLDDAELRSAHKVRREKDSKNVLRCQCPLCSANRKKEHRKEKCVAVYPDDGWGFCYNCGNWFWTEAWYDAHVAPKRSGHKAKEQKMKKNHDYRTKRDNGFAEGCNFAASKGSKGSARRYLR